ncbi:unnamed protein product [Caenorhabditis brenneri]
MSNNSAPSSPSPPESEPKVEGSLSDLAIALEQRANVVSDTSSSETAILSPTAHQLAPISHSALSVAAPVESVEPADNVINETSTFEAAAQSPNVQPQPAPTPCQDAFAAAVYVDSDYQLAESRREMFLRMIRPISRAEGPPSDNNEERPPESSESVHSSGSWRYRRYEQRNARREETVRHLGPRRHFSPPDSSDSVDNEQGGDMVDYGRRKRFLIRIEDKQYRRERAAQLRAAKCRALSEPSSPCEHTEDEQIVSSKSLESLLVELSNLYARRTIPRKLLASESLYLQNMNRRSSSTAPTTSGDFPSYMRHLASVLNRRNRRSFAPARVLTPLTNEYFEAMYVNNQPSTSSAPPQPSVGLSSTPTERFEPPFVGNQPSTSTAPPREWLETPYSTNQSSTSSAPPPQTTFEEPGPVSEFSETVWGVPNISLSEITSRSAPSTERVAWEEVVEDRTGPVSAFSETGWGVEIPSAPPSEMASRSASSTDSVARQAGVEINTDVDLTADLEDDWSIRARSTLGGIGLKSNPKQEEPYVEHVPDMPPSPQSSEYDASHSNNDKSPSPKRRRRQRK